MSCHGKDMGQLLVDYEGVWPIGTPPIKTSSHPSDFGLNPAVPLGFGAPT